jgi:hypothetical protein
MGALGEQVGKSANYNWRSCRSDLVAGLTVAAVAIPQAMAYALIQLQALAEGPRKTMGHACEQGLAVRLGSSAGSACF